jgi:hypothetical protein
MTIIKSGYTVEGKVISEFEVTVINVDAYPEYGGGLKGTSSCDTFKCKNINIESLFNKSSDDGIYVNIIFKDVNCKNKTIYYPEEVIVNNCEIIFENE